MASVSWYSYLPSGTSAVKLGDDDIRTNFQAISSAMADEHEWSQAGGAADRGRHTPNASRVSFGATASAPAEAPSGMSGVMYLETNLARRLWGYPHGASAQSTLLGGMRHIQADANPSAGYGFVQSAFTIIPNSVQSMPVEFLAAPIVVVSVQTSVETTFQCSIYTLDTVNIGVATAYAHAGPTNDAEFVHVLALGQVAF